MSAMYMVQSFTRGGRGALRADAPVQAQSLGHARRLAERLAVQKALVVAIARRGDPATGDYDEAGLIVAFGDVPDEIREMPLFDTASTV